MAGFFVNYMIFGYIEVTTGMQIVSGLLLIALLLFYIAYLKDKKRPVEKNTKEEKGK